VDDIGDIGRRWRPPCSAKGTTAIGVAVFHATDDIDFRDCWALAVAAKIATKASRMKAKRELSLNAWA
jgi:hypothetical protein